VGKAKKIILLLAAVVYTGACFAQGRYYQTVSLKHRISAGPVLSFFGKDPHALTNVNPLFGFTGSYNSEIEIIDNLNLLAGFTYANQAVQFNSYYVAPGHTYIFDNSFAYTHRLRFQSIQLPISLKLDLNSEADNPYTPYFLLGFGFSYLYSAKTAITSDSTENKVYSGKTDLSFENFVFGKKFNSFFQGGFGIQKNMRKKERALFLDLIYKYDVSRLSYTGYENSNNAHFRNSSVSIFLGLKF
jgi:hypothetical protein